MFMDHTDEVPGHTDDGFGRPVESIMRCEDFKSNFARRLSNRYSSRSTITTKRQNSVKAQQRINTKEALENAPERIERFSQLSKIRTTEQNGEVVMAPDKPMKNHNIRDTEVTALNMAIDTLRWQLTQTEANRQMHIALLKQVVTFLSRVKEHIECQSPETTPSPEEVPHRDASPCHSVVDLPRSRSVLHVNKHEYSLTTGKRLSARKMSKSINNVNGYKDCNGTWNQSKLSLSSDTDSSQKLTEEITRLITLANTVLSTKIPDLSCNCNDNNDTIKSDVVSNGTLEHNESNSSLNLIDEDTTNAFILNTIYDSEDAFNGLTDKFDDVKDVPLTDFIVSSSPLSCGLENDFAGITVTQQDENIKTQTETKTRSTDKRSVYNHTPHYIEDESGFSSMSSFQEIGIPIISIIPPSPCKEVGYIEELTDILDGAEKWKSDTMDLDKQTVKVFWV
ncbi:hypothetical protein B5X24_HaOG205321 [Helicoverpa armigera]|uniref:Uncharacterized protein n=1 Tax=Helicoverpa armigera TaxID=29058 RepID=A0A2W1BLY0_HELAM|nr:hypothetical protein B5X24_HaOG205321 [Helicoverpa armigera]